MLKYKLTTLSSVKKIGFCFLIYDIINHEELWYNFFKNIDNQKYNIYIHYKIDIPLKYFNKYKLDNCIDTKYADISIINAHNTLFKKSYNDNCYKIISLSQSCIPLKSFNYIYNFLIKNDKGYFSLTSEQCGIFPLCNSLLKYYKSEHLQKSNNWFILNRDIATKIIVDSVNPTIWKDIWCPEEIYFITTVYKNNMQSKIIQIFDSSSKSTTFTNWNNPYFPMNYKYKTKDPGDHPKNYNTIELEEINYLLIEPCLFGRKFDIYCKILNNKLEYNKLSNYLIQKICK